MDDCTDEFRYCNHHHKITKDQKLVTIGGNKFVADKKMIPLLKALNEIGLTTRTHTYDKKTGHAFISIILDQQTDMSLKKVFENAASRTKFNGETELLISWKNKKI